MIGRDVNQQKIKYAVFTLAKHPDNRCCGDCDASLDASENNTFASMEFGVWICQACSVTHDTFLGRHISRIKSIHEKWTLDELDVMKRAGSNAKRNEVLERYVPDVIQKIHVDSSDYDREIWIRAKYFSKLFMVPHYNARLRSSRRMSTDASADVAAAAAAAALPTRMMDFFMTLGPNNKIRPTILRAQSKRKMSTLSPEDFVFKPMTLSIFPEPSHYPDMPIPELIAQFAFPSGLSLSCVQLPPQFFTLILTDVSRVKLYAAVLIVHELEEPDKALELLGLPKEESSQMGWSAVYVPKALLLLSHYPFYHLFKVFLEQIYRLSLSSSPIPLERYISSFMSEVPLPPRGEKEVCFNLGDVMLQVSRPPPNQLPMVDFSYRPLFTALSVDSIIVLFRCLSAELQVCVYSSKLAILTPVQEALLSFLFPFTWQGVYIPILDANLKDVVEAPVPYLFGMHTTLVTEISQPEGVVFVDLDNDSFMFNSKVMIMSNERNDLLSRLPPLTKATYTKLKASLEEHAGFIYRRQNMRNIGNPFPNNEFTPAPISESLLRDVTVAQQRRRSMGNKFASADASQPLQPATAGGSNSRPVSSMMSVFGSKTASSPGSVLVTGSGSASIGSSSNVGTTSVGIAAAGATSVGDTEPLACTLVFDRRTAGDSLGDHRSLDRDTVTALRDNGQFGSHSNLASLIAQQQSGGNNSGHNSSGHSATGPTNANTTANTNSYKSKLRHSLLDPINNCRYGDNFDAKEARYAFLKVFVANMMTYKDALDPTKQNGFDFTKFLNHDIEPFMKNMVNTQMFSNFLNERINNPNDPDILYFDENIIAKINRSKLQLKKKPTPFLNNRSYEITDYFTCPAPSTWGIVQGKKYTYNQFPLLSRDLFGTPRVTTVLVKGPERSRAAGGNFEIAQSLIFSMQEKIIKLMNDSSGNEYFDDIDEWIATSYQRIKHIEQAVTKVQCLYRSRKLFRALRRIRRAALVLQCAGRCWLARRKRSILKVLSTMKRLVPQAIIIQSFVRMANAVHRFHRTRLHVVVLQSIVRRHQHAKRYLLLRKNVILTENVVRGWLTRKHIHKRLIDTLSERKALVLCLWTLAHTSLCYRSLFWTMSTTAGVVRGKVSLWLALAMWSSELDRLYSELGGLSVLKTNSNITASTLAARVGAGVMGNPSKGLTAAAKFALVDKCEIVRLLRSKLPSVLAQSKDLSAVPKTSPLQDLVSKLPTVAHRRLNHNMSLERSEREALYWVLKGSSDDETKNSFFSRLGIASPKKRKQKLSNSLWLDISLTGVEQSQEVVFSIWELLVGGNYTATTSSTPPQYVFRLQESMYSAASLVEQGLHFPIARNNAMASVSAFAALTRLTTDRIRKQQLKLE